MKTGIVLLNYNNYKITIKCLQALFNHYDKKNSNLVIVENGSINNSLSIISDYLKRSKLNHKIIYEENLNENSVSNIDIISIKDNVGYARGNNFGIRHLIKRSVEYIAILTNDIIINNNIFPGLISSLNSNVNLGIVSPVLIKEDETIDYNCCRRSPSNFDLFILAFKFLNFSLINDRLDKLKFLKYSPKLLDNKIIECEILSGSCLLAKASLWKNLGGFDENTYLYFEENILFHKLRERNLKSAIISDQKVVHLGAQSTKTMISSKLLNAEIESLLYYLKKYRMASVWIIIPIKAVWNFRIFVLKIYKRLKNKSE